MAKTAGLIVGIVALACAAFIIFVSDDADNFVGGHGTDANQSNINTKQGDAESAADAL